MWIDPFEVVKSIKGPPDPIRALSDLCLSSSSGCGIDRTTLFADVPSNRICFRNDRDGPARGSRRLLFKNGYHEAFDCRSADEILCASTIELSTAETPRLFAVGYLELVHGMFPSCGEYSRLGLAQCKISGT